MWICIYKEYAHIYLYIYIHIYGQPYRRYPISITVLASSGMLHQTQNLKPETPKT